MTSKKYYKKRKDKDLASLINKTEDYINIELSDIYKNALKDVAKDINKIYDMFAKDGKITLAEAKAIISKGDLKSKGFKDVANKLKSNTTMLKLVEMQIQARLNALYDREQINLYEYLYNTYKDTYYKTMFDIDSDIGITLSFNLPHDKAIHNAIYSDWSSKNFANRIWGRKKQTFNTIKTTIIKGLIKGVSVDKMVKELQKQIDVSKKNAKRLVRTEANYAFNKGTLDAYKESGVVDKYMYLATFDNRTSAICKNLDGAIFDLSKAQHGTNYPPMHPNCRSTVVAYFDDYKYKRERKK